MDNESIANSHGRLSAATLYLITRTIRDMVFYLSSYYESDQANDELVKSFLEDVTLVGGNRNLSELMHLKKEYGRVFNRPTSVSVRSA